MTTQTVTGLSAFNGTTPTQAWWQTVKLFSDMITALGFPKTTDTGQVDWTTVAVPTGADVTRDYEVRKFNDADQTAHPIFMKLTYSYAINGSTRVPYVTMIIGTGSNGSGTITGIITTLKFVIDWQTSLHNNWFASSDGTGFALYLGGYNDSWFSRQFFVLERARDINGTIMPTQVIWCKNTANTSSGPVQQDVQSGVLDLSLGTAYVQYGINVPYPVPLKSTSISMAALPAPAAFYPFCVWSMFTNSGKAYGKHVVGWAAPDFLSEAEVTVPRFSTLTNIIYKCLKPSGGAHYFGMMSDASAINSTANHVTGGCPAIYWQ